MMKDPRILCVDDEENVLRSLKRLFMDNEYEILTAASATEGLKMLHERPVQIILSDYRMPGMNGVEFLREVCGLWPDTVRIVLSGYADTSAVIAAINEGRIYKFIPKPWNDDELKVTIANAFERYALYEQNICLAAQLKKKNDELLSLNTILKERITDEIGELKSRNKELSYCDTTLRSLPLPLVTLDSGGRWISYYNEKARQLFDWNADDKILARRSDVFGNDLKDVIDRTVETGAGVGTVTINGRTRSVHSVIVDHAPGYRGITLIFSENGNQNR